MLIAWRWDGGIRYGTLEPGSGSRRITEIEPEPNSIWWVRMTEPSSVCEPTLGMRLKHPDETWYTREAP